MNVDHTSAWEMRNSESFAEMPADAGNILKWVYFLCPGAAVGALGTEKRDSQ